MNPTGYSFEYRRHLGLDCYMNGDCGYIIRLSPDRQLTYLRDKGDLEHQADTVLTAIDQKAFLDLLQNGGFFDYPPELPHPESRRGMTTVTMTFDTDSVSAQTIIAHVDETNYPFPDGFLSLEAEIRSFLLDRLSIDRTVKLDTTRKIF